MRKIIINNEENCVGCNRCIRACPVEDADYVKISDGKIKVSVNSEGCIACGSCIKACRHDVRDYVDDIELFMEDLKKGVGISLIVAPANRMNGNEGGRLLTWLRQLGVRKIYDVSLGADICTWAHIRHIQKNKPASVITQPCPAIVNYIQLYAQDLLKYLSPVHSPMLCTAIYMSKYERISDPIAAISPCIAKSSEFEATGYVKYNVTLKKLLNYVKDNNITLPDAVTGFDHPGLALGCMYSMPGGLRENIEFYFGKKLRVDQAEGTHVYDSLKEFSMESEENLPTVFDVLNCADGCNIGTGTDTGINRFRADRIMDDNRQNILDSVDYDQYDHLLQEFDRKLHIEDFIRRYTPRLGKHYNVTDDTIEKAFISLNKMTDEDRSFDCSACGSDSCAEMAKRIAMGIDIPDNCIQKLRNEVVEEQQMILQIAMSNKKSTERLSNDISGIKTSSGEIADAIKILNDVIQKYADISNDILSIASYINIISLNASIEAARAGVHGKAFAVVAEEIRSLAGRSQKTVSESDAISVNASESITTVNDMVSSIVGDIEKAHISISLINQSLSSALENNKSERG